MKPFDETSLSPAGDLSKHQVDAKLPGSSAA